MKRFKFGLRIWITIASLVAFTGSWMVLSHSPKPVQWPVTAPTLAPLPPMPQQADQSNSLLAFLQQQSAVRPRRSAFRTGGS
jgi:hypothetical protein